MFLIRVTLFLPPATKLWQGNVFTPVCHSVHTPLWTDTPRTDTPPQADTQWADTPLGIDPLSG